MFYSFIWTAQDSPNPTAAGLTVPDQGAQSVHAYNWKYKNISIV
jgi:hypothetical protein